MTKIVKARVKPNASKNKIRFNEEKGIYEVSVKAKPEKGMANAMVIKLFRQLFKKRVSILKGKTSKDKLLRIE